MKKKKIEVVEGLFSFPDGWKGSIREMVIGDYDGAVKLWQEIEHLSLNECDTKEGIDLYLNRNKGMCFVAHEGASIVGTVLCGHDGRRGFLRHLAVLKSRRKLGIARLLVDRALEELSRQGIGKCNIFVLNLNLLGHKFWRHMGWVTVEDTYKTLQKPTPTSWKKTCRNETNEQPSYA